MFKGSTQLALRHRSDIHLARKLWHMFGVVGMVALYTQISTDMAIRILSVVSFFFVGFDILRLQWPSWNRFAVRVAGFLMRDNESKSFAGTTYLMIGTFILVWFFPRPVVTLSLLFLAFADPMASYFGIRYGKDKLIGSKSLQGTLAAFVTCTVITVIFLVQQNLMTDRILIVSFCAGLLGALAELVPIAKLDDNFTIPVLSAIGIWTLMTIFGGLT